MITKDIVDAAYRQKPIPVGLRRNDEIEYVMMRALYRMYLRGDVSESYAKDKKREILKIDAFISNYRQHLYGEIYSLLVQEYHKRTEQGILVDMGYIEPYYEMLYGCSIKILANEIDVNDFFNR